MFYGHFWSIYASFQKTILLTPNIWKVVYMFECDTIKRIIKNSSHLNIQFNWHHKFMGTS